MTHALHEFISNPTTYEDIATHPEKVDQLSAEIRFTAEEARTRQVTPEIVSELKKAVGLLVQTDAPELQKLYPAAEAAAVTHDPALMEVVGDILQTSYPIGPDTDDPNFSAINTANRSMHREFVAAVRMTGEHMPFATALSRAAIMTESITGQTFDDILNISDLKMHESRGRARERKLLETSDGNSDGTQQLSPDQMLALLEDDKDEQLAA